MSKKVTITKEIEEQLRKSLEDSSVNAADYSIFEARLLTTEPLTKRGSIWDRGRITSATLTQMADFVNAGGTVPLQIMHEDEYLPVGKLFMARTSSLANGETQLLGMFFISNTESKLIASVEDGTIGEVSVGLLTKNAFCSECKFDYLSPEASILNFLDRTCPEGHTIGQEGVHLIGANLDVFNELSLVGAGASNQAKILPRAKQTLSQETLTRLAASSTVPIDARFVMASSKIEDANLPTKQGDKKMDKEAIEKIASLSSELGQKTATLGERDKTIAELTTQLSAMKTELSAAQEAAKPLAEIQAKLTATEKVITDLTAKLHPHAKAALVATGTPEAEIPADLTGLFSLIEGKGLKLHQVLGAAQADPARKVDDATAAEAAFAARRRSAFNLDSKE